MLKDKNIAFLGAGSMAEAMISGIVDSKKVPLSQITVSNHHNKERLITLKKKYNIQTVSTRTITNCSARYYRIGHETARR